MLYKVTPLLAPAAQKPAMTGEARRVSRRRKSAVYDSEGHEVLITLMCLKCHRVKPLVQFGLRRMPDGAVRNQPWCKECRGAVGLPRIAKDSEPTKAEAAPAQPGAAEPVDAQLEPFAGQQGP